MSPEIPHGGDSQAFRQLFGGTRMRVDLSTGINPVAWPVPPLPADAWRRLPEKDREADLRAAAATCLQAGSAAHVALAPGSQALIQWLPRLRRPGPVAVTGPTYGEHARCWALAGHRPVTVPSLAAALETRAPVIVAVHPNNPDGRLLDRQAVLDAAASQAGRGGILVIDEAFADTVPERSLAALAGHPGLVILRSFGKFFGLAGIRLGFLLADPGTVTAVTTAMGPWAVAGPALEIGIAALEDTEWISTARSRLNRDAARLDSLLAARGLAVAGGTSLFRLVDSPAAGALFRHLGGSGIFTRSFPDHPHWLRFGLPGTARDWDELEQALAGFPAP